MVKPASAHLEHLLFAQHLETLGSQGPEPQVVKSLVQNDSRAETQPQNQGSGAPCRPSSGRWCPLSRCCQPDPSVHSDTLPACAPSFSEVHFHPQLIPLYFWSIPNSRSTFRPHILTHSFGFGFHCCCCCSFGPCLQHM